MRVWATASKGTGYAGFNKKNWQDEEREREREGEGERERERRERERREREREREKLVCIIIIHYIILFVYYICSVTTSFLKKNLSTKEVISVFIFHIFGALAVGSLKK